MSLIVDSYSDGGDSNLTWNHTCTGTNIQLIIIIFHNGTLSSYGAYYNGVQAVSEDLNPYGDSYGNKISAYRVYNAATGTNQVQFYNSTATRYRGMAISYTGADISGTFTGDRTAGVSYSNPYTKYVYYGNNTQLVSAAFSFYAGSNCDTLTASGVVQKINVPMGTSNLRAILSATDIYNGPPVNITYTASGSGTFASTVCYIIYLREYKPSINSNFFAFF